MEDHPLRREIIVTQVVNDLVNGAGMTFWPRLQGETGASPADLTRANFVAREIFGSLPLRQEIAALDNAGAGRAPDPDAHRDAHPGRARLALAGHQPAAPARLAAPRSTSSAVPGPGGHGRAARHHERARARRLPRPRAKRLTDHGVPDDLASRVAVLASAYALLGIVETADRLDLDPVEVARVHFALGERLGLPALVERIFALPRDDRWQTMARAAVRDDLYGVHQQLTAQVLESTDAADSAPARVAEWEDADEELVGRAAVDAGGDLPRGDRRARPPVGRPAGGARPALLRPVGQDAPGARPSEEQ